MSKLINAALQGYRYFQGLNKLLANMSGFIIIAMMLIVCYEVMMSYFFDAPTTWVMDISIFLFLAALFLPQAYTQQSGQHVRMDSIYLRLPKQLQVILDLISSSISLFFWVLFSWSAIDYALEAHRMHTTTISVLYAPIWPILTVIAVGVTLLCFQILIDFIVDINKCISKFRRDESSC